MNFNTAFQTLMQVDLVQGNIKEVSFFITSSRKTAKKMAEVKVGDCRSHLTHRILTLGME